MGNPRGNRPRSVTSSALSALANAVATFVVAGAGVATDPDTGNVQAVTETLTVSLFLRAEDVEVLRYPGVDQHETLFEGYAVTPAVLDVRVIPGTTGTLAFAGGAAVPCEVKTVALPFGRTGLLGQTLGQTLGTKVQLVSRRVP